MLLGDTELGGVELGSLRSTGVAPSTSFVEEVPQATIYIESFSLSGRTCWKYPVVVARIGVVLRTPAVKIETIRETL